MTRKNIILKTPDSLEIVGIKLTDGSVSTFEYSYDNANKTMMYILPSGNTSKLFNNGGDYILIDSNGNEWNSTDIEYHSLLTQ